MTRGAARRAAPRGNRCLSVLLLVGRLLVGRLLVGRVLLALGRSTRPVRHPGPIGNTEPDALEQDGVNAAPNPSTAVAVYVTTAPRGEVAFTTTAAGTVTLGAAPAATTTENEPLLELPCASVAEQDTVVEPIG